MEDYNGVGKTHLPKIRDLRDSIHANYGEDAEIDWEIVHNAGCTCDDTELPHHVSEPGEIQELLTQFHVTLEKWTETGSRPLAVTMARSSGDSSPWGSSQATKGWLTPKVPAMRASSLVAIAERSGRVGNLNPKGLRRRRA